MDTPESLAADLLKAAAKSVVETRAITQKAALNIKTQAKANVQQSAPAHNAHAHQAITYDTKIGATAIDAEIGYDKDKRGGALGNILEYGSRNNEPHRDLGRALDDEEPRFVDFLTRMAEGLL